MSRITMLALPVLLLSMSETLLAQVCAGSPMSAGSIGVSALAARETLRENNAFSASVRWKARNWVALDGGAGFSELFGSNQIRGGAGVTFELPLKRFSLCAFGGAEHRSVRYDLSPAINGIDAYTDRDWVFPVGIALGYSQPINTRASLFGYIQPHYVYWHTAIDGTGSTSDVAFWKNNPGVRGGLGFRLNRVLLGAEGMLTGADEANAIGLRLTYVTK